MSEKKTDNIVLIFWAIMLISAVALVFYQVNYQSVPPSAAVEQPAASGSVAAIYQQNCARCHGANGEGMAMNPPLKGRNLPIEHILHIVQDGKGTMPAFPGIKEPQLTELAGFIHSMQ